MVSDFSFSSELIQDLGMATPSLKLSVYKGGGEVIYSEFGETYPIYDLASLTKVIFTVTALMWAEEKGLLKAEDKVSDHLDWFPSQTIELKHLLAHYSGLEWWLPVYEHLREQDLVGRSHYPKNWNAVRELIQTNEIKENVKEVVYSDLDFWVLGFVLEKVFEKPLDEIWQDLNFEMQLDETDFSVDNEPVFDPDEYAPTENCSWRGKVLRGEVHDDNTWALGGVCSHAGLFGSIEDVVKWASGLREAYFGGSWVVSKDTVRKYSQHTGPGFWALGFMRPNTAESTAGTKISPNSIGHWGFTGTGIWFDPDNDIIIATLANRVHPTRDNSLFHALRGRIHDEVYTYLGVHS